MPATYFVLVVFGAAKALKIRNVAYGSYVRDFWGAENPKIRNVAPCISYFSLVVLGKPLGGELNKKWPRSAGYPSFPS